MEIYEIVVSHPDKSFGVLLFIVGCIDYLAGSTPSKKDDNYVGLSRRIIHYLKKITNK